MKSHEDTGIPVYCHKAVARSGIPLGGLGTGTVELRPDGCFHDWQIFNDYTCPTVTPNPYPPPRMTALDAHFALRVQSEGRGPQVRLLFDDAGEVEVSLDLPAWIPWLRSIPEISFDGRFPFANLSYRDDSLPVELSLEAFSPFIPLNAKDSALPLIFFVFRARNLSSESCSVSLLFSLKNCVGYDLERRTLRSEVSRSGGTTFIAMTADDVEPDHRTYGSMVIAATEKDTTHRAAWTTRQREMDCWHLWNEFMVEGSLSDLDQWIVEAPRDDEHGIEEQWRGALCSTVSLQPQEEKEIIFAAAWFFPNQLDLRVPAAPAPGVTVRPGRVGHMYQNWFQDALDVARYGVDNFDRLRGESRRFCEHQYRGTLEPWLNGLLNAQLTPFSANSYWDENGDFGVWEGGPGFGGRICIPSYCFPGLLFFPEIDKKALSIMAHSQRSDGWVGGWLGYDSDNIACCIDFQAQFPLEVYRHYLWTGDKEFLSELWPAVKRSLSVLSKADTNDDGLPDEAETLVQVYDWWRFPGTHSYLGSVWMAGLKAAVRMAMLLGEEETASSYQAMLEKTGETFEEMFWNGEYYRLLCDLENGFVHEGCMADQVHGQWCTRLLGLGAIHDEEHVRSALEAVFRHNRSPEAKALLNGSDPKGRVDNWAAYLRPEAYPYVKDQWTGVWSGTEFAVSSMIILEGLVDEGLQVAKDVYDRHRDNGLFWKHIEWGGHYPRPMCAWSILLALQGLEYDAAEGSLRFVPRVCPEAFDSLFVMPGVWGRIMQTISDEVQRDELQIEAGEISLKTLILASPDKKATGAVGVSLDGKEVPCTVRQEADVTTVVLDQPARLGRGQRLTVDRDFLA